MMFAARFRIYTGVVSESVVFTHCKKVSTILLNIRTHHWYKMYGARSPISVLLAPYLQSNCDILFQTSYKTDLL